MKSDRCSIDRSSPISRDLAADVSVEHICIKVEPASILEDGGSDNSDWRLPDRRTSWRSNQECQETDPLASLASDTVQESETTLKVAALLEDGGKSSRESTPHSSTNASPNTRPTSPRAPYAAHARAHDKKTNEARKQNTAHTCELCDKEFLHLRSLNRHKQSHTGDKPFSCEICQKKFMQSGYLNKHKRIHSGDKPHTCEICDKKFTQLCNLKTHKRIHTGERRYSCSVCKKKFTAVSNLMRHERIHTGDNPYSCEICDKSYSRLGRLKAHKQTHKL